MVKNITEKSEVDGALVIYNRSKKRATDLSAKLAPGKTEVADSIEAGVSKADIIFICVANDQAVTETVGTIVKTDIKGKLIVDCSTIHPDTVGAIAEIITSKGAEFVSCPVFGSPPMADAGVLVAVPAGPKAAVDKIKPYLEGVTARALIDMTDEPYQKAATLKLVGNTFVLNMVEQIAEGHVLAEKSGLGTRYTHQFLELLMPGIYPAYSDRMLSGDYWKREEPLAHVDILRKDAAHARSIANEAGVTMANLETADAHMAKVQELVKDGDLAGIYGALRKESGLEYKNDA